MPVTDFYLLRTDPGGKMLLSWHTAAEPQGRIVACSGLIPVALGFGLNDNRRLV